MLTDPIDSRVHNVSGTGLEEAFDINIDRISTGAGTATYKASSAIAGVTLVCTTKHEVTKAGRRRSSMRVDVKSPAGNAVITESPTEHSASAYIVLDRRDDDSQNTKAVIDHAWSALLNALIASRTAGVNHVLTTAATDFLNGEP